MLKRLTAMAGLLAALPMLAAAQQSGTWVIDAEASDVHWRVYKAGAFARFGHNHVVSVAGLDGTVTIDADGDAEWSLSFDVDDLIVDDPALRALYGADFESEPTPEDIEGTKGNMLSETVLNGEQFSTIRVSGGSYAGDLDDATLRITIEMLGRSIEREVPGGITIDGDTLIAEGDFTLEHADLGMEPFSVMMGALQVGPTLDFHYRIHAVSAD